MARQQEADFPIRVQLPDGAEHVVRRPALAAVALEFPQALRIERADVAPMPACAGCRQPPGSFWG